ncbi:hypothetical protein HN51_062636 [Arachis hypogaea]
MSGSRKLSVKASIERYKKASSDSSNGGSTSEINAQHYQQESAKLRVQISNLQNHNRQDLKNLLGLYELISAKEAVINGGAD